MVVHVTLAVVSNSLFYMLIAVVVFRGGRDRPDRGRDRDRVSMSREEGEMSDRRGSRFPDSHQLFVGNLPHNVSDKELKAFFEGNLVLMSNIFYLLTLELELITVSWVIIYQK